MSTREVMQMALDISALVCNIDVVGVAAGVES